MNRVILSVLLILSCAQGATAQSPQVGPQSHMLPDLESAFQQLFRWTEGFATSPHTAGLEYFQTQTLTGTLDQIQSPKSKKCHLIVFYSKTPGVRKAQLVFAQSETAKVAEGFGAWSSEPEATNTNSVLLEVGEASDGHLFWGDDRPTNVNANEKEISIRQDSSGDVQTFVLSLGENRRPSQLVATSERNRKIRFTRTCRF